MNQIRTGAIQIGTGSVEASQFNLPDGSSLGAPPVIVWEINEVTSPDIYFITGNIGLGTQTPANLLELSNVGPKLFKNPVDPTIMWDNNNTPQFSVGIDTDDNQVLRFEPGGTLGSSAPPLTMKGDFLGIQTNTPRSDLDVSGNAIFQRLRIGTSNISQVFTASSLNASPMYIDSKLTGSSGTPWTRSTGNRIYINGVNIGMNIATPNANLDVSGNVSANNIIVNEKLTIKDKTQLNGLDFF